MWSFKSQEYFDADDKLIAIKRIESNEETEVPSYFYLKVGYGEVKTTQLKFEQSISQAKYYITKKDGKETRSDL